MKAIDLYAGLGGSTEGAKQAGVDVVWAANHWPVANHTHEANHPETKHTLQDLQQADFRDIPPHTIGMASPACPGHSIARGKDKPHHDASRATAWAPVTCAEIHRQPCWVIENVSRFLKWELYPAWEMAWSRLGYTLAPHLLDSADHGIPQNRVRVFIIATRSKSPFALCPIRREHVSATTILDEGGAFSSIRSLCLKSRRRIAAGRRQHGDRFIVSYYSKGSGLGGRSVHRPLPTVTTKDRFALIEGNRSRFLTVNELRKAMGFPDGYILPVQKAVAKHLLGNAVPPGVMRDILLDLKERL